MDWEEISIPKSSDTTKSIIPEFYWPEGVGTFAGASFLSVIVQSETAISNLAEITFGWTDEPGVTPTPTPPASTPDFVYIAPGTFQMGSPGDEICRDPNDEQLHSVTISHGFYMQSTEVTQQQWVNVFGNNPSSFTGMNRPVENVTWYDCCVYCNRLSVSEALTPCYYSDAAFTTVFDGTPPVTDGPVYWKQDADGYRLPTEAEWEYACRYYSASPQTDPTGPATGTLRAARSGSWFDSAMDCRAANRTRTTPENNNYNLGFRVLKSTP